ncbi:helix-turn-helix domain-containing protein [Acidaminobacter sp. JC074]|uniref:PocR ligand-binding domain-containing protein n=1 Tax=Acidaminobacter sp. JC074 TaxID=2530199 RepID=UPI001F100F4C|nr:PocR ligand-binding domain-containing protein [Acidaminobacter sp. JC074]MCH4887550.1 helix-turn-helix domain-containing protein [Acidaminobacter sp. JC074]
MLLEKGHLNIPVIKELLEVFYHSTGISAKFIDDNGKTISSIGDEFSFCNYFHSIADKSNCNQTHLYSGLQAKLQGEAYIFFCHAGLTEFTYPVSYEGVFKGSFIAGPILMAYPDEYFVDEIIKKNHLDINEKSRIKSYVRTIPVVEPPRVRHLSKLLQLMVSSQINDDLMEMKKRQTKTEQQMAILNTISDYKSSTHDFYPFDKEQALLKYVRKGESQKARQVLNELLGYIFYDTGVDIEVSKSRALEMSALISRAAIEGGADAHLLFGLSNQYIKDLSDVKSMDDLSFWMLTILNNFTEHVINVNDAGHPLVIRNALKYIHGHYLKSITLQDTADKVELSPKYFSAIFKKEMKIAFSEYINVLRINDAKRMLKNTNQTVLEIAISLGFEDQSYFTKVFKKHTSLTPLKYRKVNG